MRVLSLATAGQLLIVACGGPTGPTASFPAATASPSASRPAASPEESPGPLPTELALGQTFGLYYDPQIERVILVNGTRETGPAMPTELWSWSGTAWELLDATGSEARGFAAIGRDPVRNVLVVHGGLSSSGTAYDETLEWDGQSWTVHVAGETGPGPREGAGLAYEPDTGRMLPSTSLVGQWSPTGHFGQRVGSVPSRNLGQSHSTHRHGAPSQPISASVSSASATSSSSSSSPKVPPTLIAGVSADEIRVGSLDSHIVGDTADTFTVTSRTTSGGDGRDRLTPR